MAKNPSSVLLSGIPKKADNADIMYYCEPFGKVSGIEFVDDSSAIVTFKQAEDAAALKTYKKFTIFHETVSVKFYDRRPKQPKEQPKPKAPEPKPAPVQPVKKQQQQQQPNGKQQQQQAPAKNQRPNTAPAANQRNQPQQQQQQQKPPRTVIFHNVPKGIDTEDCEYAAGAFGQLRGHGDWINKHSIVLEFKTTAAAERIMDASKEGSFAIQGKKINVKFYLDPEQKQKQQAVQQQQQPVVQKQQQPQQRTAGGSDAALSKKELKRLEDLKLQQQELRQRIRDIEQKKR